MTEVGSAIVFDLETFSSVDLGDTGVDAYARHASTDALCCSWQWISAAGACVGEPGSWRPGHPPALWAALPDVDAWAWNVNFDRAIYDRVLVPRYGWPARDPARFRCLLARAAYANLPLGLAAAGAVLAAEHQKDAVGHRLMMRLARPARPTTHSADPRRLHSPEALDALAAYCRQDVIAEAALVRLLPALPADEERVFALDRRINDRGVGVDLDLVRACKASAETLTELLREELLAATGGAVERETRLAALSTWLRARGVAVATGKGAMDKAAVAEHLRQLNLRLTLTPGDPDLRVAARVLRIRQALGRTSIAKFDALLAAAPEGRLRGGVQYGGAHQTLRWAGRLVQPQNMPKGILGSSPVDGPTYAAARAAVLASPGDAAYLCALYGDGTDIPADPTAARQTPGLPAVLSSLLRCCFAAAPGRVLVVADYAAVEARGVLWLANDATGLAAFAAKQDLYKIAAGKILGIAPDAVSKADRNRLGKPTVLGAGYGLGPAKFAATFGTSEEIGVRAVAAYRSTFSGVPALWKAVERAAVAAVREPGLLVQCAGNRVAFQFNGRHLRARLPSGRLLWYRDAILVAGRFDGTVVIEFASEDMLTRRWTRGTIWGGTFVENLVQALCRDLLAVAMINLEAEGLPVVLHSHDEAVVEVDAPLTAGHTTALVHRVESIMCRLPPWAAGFPVAAEGFASPFWRK